jgi:hypothetical protein
MLTRTILFLVMAGAAPAFGQSADEQYHAAAQAYIAGDVEGARAAAVAGLRAAPDHARLQALLALLEEPEPPPAGVGAAGEGGPGDDGSPESGDDPDSSEEPGDDDGNGEGEGVDDGDAGDASRGQGAEEGAGAMHPDEADRILRAIEEDEQDVLRDVTRRRTSNRSQEKDW